MLRQSTHHHLAHRSRGNRRTQHPLQQLYRKPFLPVVALKTFRRAELQALERVLEVAERSNIRAADLRGKQTRP